MYFVGHITLFAHVQLHVFPTEAKKYETKLFLGDCLIDYPGKKKKKPSQSWPWCRAAKVRPTCLCPRFTRKRDCNPPLAFLTLGAKPLACAAVHASSAIRFFSLPADRPEAATNEEWGGNYGGNGRFAGCTKKGNCRLFGLAPPNVAEEEDQLRSEHCITHCRYSSARRPESTTRPPEIDCRPSHHILAPVGPPAPPLSASPPLRVSQPRRPRLCFRSRSIKIHLSVIHTNDQRRRPSWTSMFSARAPFCKFGQRVLLR